jgi:hypothetical protein
MARQPFASSQLASILMPCKQQPSSLSYAGDDVRPDGRFDDGRARTPATPFPQRRRAGLNIKWERFFEPYTRNPRYCPDLRLPLAW